ncbi:MAG: membrane protein insertase YidC [Proteobacteria bacterium]|nr:membrane protein insertase YidC [Pseudomonadota bacterium]
MDWKIIAITVAVLIVFFSVRKCSDNDEPNFDRIQAQKRATRKAESSQKKIKEHQQKTRKLLETAREARGKRPIPTIKTLETEDYKAVLTTRGAALKSFTLKNPQYLEAPRSWETGLRDEDTKKHAPVDLVSTNTENFELSSPLRFEIYQSKGFDPLLPNADYEIVEATDSKVLFRYVQPNVPVIIHKKFEIDDEKHPFQIWLTIQVTNTGQSKVSFRAGVSQHGYQHTSEIGGSMFSKRPNLMQGICRYGDEVKAFPWNDEDLNQPFSGIGDIGFVGVETNFFLSAMIPGDDTLASCFVAKVLDNKRLYPTHDLQPWGHVKADIRFGEVELKAGESKIFKVKNYLGPKRYRLLQSIGHGLESSVDFGWFWPICKVLLSLLFAFQSVLINWGLSIILLTVLVKVVLMPLTHRSFKSADKMKALKPEVDKINEQYKDDAQAKQQAVMALYKQNKVNPLGGCVPTLLQMPIWIALYNTLRTSPELYHAPFFGWITDLSSPDPYFITPIVMGAMMFVQQKFAPMTGDSAQAKMMLYFMPIMFTAMMLFLPSGLTLYILVNTVLSIAHQVFIHRRSQKT